MNPGGVDLNRPREGAAAAALSAVYGGLMRAVEPPINRLQRAIGAARMPYFFIAPNLAIFGIFVITPMLLNIWYGFTGGTSIELASRPFVGGENFASLLRCADYLDPASCERDRFWRGLYNTGFFVALQVSLMVLLSLATALVLNRRIIGRGFFRAVYFYPVLLSPVVVALIWKWVLQRSGALNAGLEAVGTTPVQWLLEPGWARFWAIFVSIWAHMGFYTLILLAGLQSIPAELYEAAQMDGTPGWRVFWRITLPLLMPTMLVVLVLGLIRAVQVFDEVYVLTGGGPGSATLFMVQFIYETGFSNQLHILGLAAAASMILGLTLLVLTLLQLRLGQGTPA
ncbi:MAG: sugar ABC transporter permease [Proteobacteria bacterium]|nr:sugar ABC transporter permease [Pseudomonadota bacterium]MBI3496645.1 sugar ABC transporter permease [Pseudomonadota bacterium]